jgi:hypothetical protein
MASSRFLIRSTNRFAASILSCPFLLRFCLSVATLASLFILFLSSFPLHSHTCTQTHLYTLENKSISSCVNTHTKYGHFTTHLYLRLSHACIFISASFSLSLIFYHLILLWHVGRSLLLFYISCWVFHPHTSVLIVSRDSVCVPRNGSVETTWLCNLFVFQIVGNLKVGM